MFLIPMSSYAVSQNSYHSELTSHTDTSVGLINRGNGHRARRNLIPRGLFSSVVRGSLLNEGCHALLSVPRRDDLKRERSGFRNIGAKNQLQNLGKCSAHLTRA